MSTRSPAWLAQSIDARSTDSSRRRVVPGLRADVRHRDVIALGFAAVLWGASALAARLMLAAGQPLVGVAVFYVGLLVGVVYSWSRLRPLLALSWRDVLYGVVLGLALRTVYGFIISTPGVDLPAPVIGGYEGSFAIEWWLDVVAPAILVAPPVEELFFHGVILVAIVGLAERTLPPWIVGGMAMITPAVPFVLSHAIFGPLSPGSAAALALVGLTCAWLVFSTGRIWGAIFVHTVYNASYIVLQAVGTSLS